MLTELAILLKIQGLGVSTRISDSRGLVWNKGICVGSFVGFFSLCPRNVSFSTQMYTISGSNQHVKEAMSEITILENKISPSKC